MTNRISATVEAVRIVRPALEKFYNSLSEEQQARFNTPQCRRAFAAAAGSERAVRYLR
jgi:LTXXQ motif family protein